jgi:pilus assembly protein CpaB
MKNKRALVMMAVAILLGIGAVVLASRWLLGQSGAHVSRIAIATADVNRGERLGADMVRMADWPVKDAPLDAFTDLSKLNDRVLKANVLKGEPLSESKLAPAGTTGGLSALIGEGRRAITVRVNDVIGVAGFALPGNYVDIIVHTQRDPGAGERGAAQHISKIVLERILVLAVAQEVSRDETKPKVVNAVTLEVTPEQAENLDLARGVGTLSLALRNQVDSSVPATTGATKLTLLDEPAPAAAAPPKPAAAPIVQVKRQCVSVLNGLQTAQECF